jgi:DNA helicase-2/ATP-dependent DNA helicase PcrA
MRSADRSRTLDAAGLLELGDLIVDEFQDLNPMDLRFVDALISAGVRVFVAGDDDQSLYSFRFASPAGIQGFDTAYPGSGDHALEACFRCTPVVLNAALNLIASNAAPGRIPKTLRSLYEESDPPVQGAIGVASYRDGRVEAAAIAASCDRLVAAGFDPRSILILLSNQRAQGPDLFSALADANVPFERPREANFRDEDQGRLVLAVARIASNPQDYVAHRTLLGLVHGVGSGTCNAVASATIAGNLNYRDLFYNPVPEGAFSGRGNAALSQAQMVCSDIAGWAQSDTLDDRRHDICHLIEAVLGDIDLSPWMEYCARLPGGMTLEELRTLLMLDKDEQQADHLIDVYRRLGGEMPDEAFPPKVRIMSMHGTKGLSARVVFIPGLEEQIIPGPRRQPYPGLVLEAARMLYVSITRARLACILSYSERRFMNGRMRRQTVSRFTVNLGHVFRRQEGGITQETADALFVEAANL